VERFIFLVVQNVPKQRKKIRKKEQGADKMENQLYVDHVVEKYGVTKSKNRDQKPVEASIKPSAMQVVKSRWARFVASLTVKSRLLDRPGFYHNETLTPDQVRQKVYMPDRFGFRY
jgi:hypothetical protein